MAMKKNTAVKFSVSVVLENKPIKVLRGETYDDEIDENATITMVAINRRQRATLARLHRFLNDGVINTTMIKSRQQLNIYLS